MSYTLTGRLQARLLAALPAFVAMAALVAVLHVWWPLELVACMVAVGVALDVAAWHWLLPYQPGVAALPLGLVELAAIWGTLHWLGIAVPTRAALAVFAGTWLYAQVLGHAVLPLAQADYAEAGGELGRRGRAVALAVVAALPGSAAVAWATQPPTVRLAAGVHQGPLRIDRAERLVGAPGAVVRGGIVIAHDDVEVRDLTVVGGDDGIDVEDATDVRLVRVRVSGAKLDQIHVRRSTVAIRDCVVDAGSSQYAQGIDIGFAFDLHPSMVTGCVVRGGREGIVSHFANVMIHGNVVSDTSLRAITVTEMSMGMVERNRVQDSLGVGVFCGDHSECDIVDNDVAGTRADTASGDLTRAGFGILAHYGAIAHVDGNVVSTSPGGIAARLDGEIIRDGG